MSKIGKRPVDILPGVKINLQEGYLKVEGPKGKLEFRLSEDIACEQKDNKLFFNALKDTKPVRALFGTTRALAKNMIVGVVSGFSKTLVIEGVGYKAQIQGKNLRLNVGFTHPVDYPIPEGIKIDASKQVEIVITGVDKAQVGQVSAEIRRVCPPEPYKGKGIRYKDERIRRKVGKAVTK
ncbi:MAG: 50S ribosomal protein L6 [Candidatus Omnitrophica bacterium]|nr:50S ribosomal protein L6 [Candidatus Omnitrophota bacterium]MDD5574299.1 50S ribosomal protein L6 [Candidatus Omnitrophota bacterium]